ncbi:helix-turn-helix domain-containing protein [Novosphingobium nitrogenifigens]
MTHLLSPLEEQDRGFFALSNRGLLIPRQHGADSEVETVAFDNLLDSDFDLETFETRLITRAVERAGGNLSRAAKDLGITRPQLAYRYKKIHGEAE